MTIAIIPARGGSKRIERKNIKDFCGKPMIAWSIYAALNSKLFDRVIISTDDDEIANLASGLGAEIPFTRPEELSDDFATTGDVMAHAVKALDVQDPFCCIYATAPFVSAKDLQSGHEILNSGDWDYVFSATTFAFPIQRALRIESDGKVSMFDESHETTRSQDLEEAWHDAGQFYWGTAEAFAQKRPVFSSRSTIVKLPRARVQDIDTLEDWETAEVMFKALGSGK